MCRGQESSQRPQPGPVTGSLEAGNPERAGETGEAGEARGQGQVEARAGQQRASGHTQTRHSL